MLSENEVPSFMVATNWAGLNFAERVISVTHLRPKTATFALFPHKIVTAKNVLMDLSMSSILHRNSRASILRPMFVT